MRAATRLGGLLLALAVGCLGAAPAGAAASDPWITTKTKIALITAEGVHGVGINVDTVNGRVTLHGKVATAAEKAKAAEIASTVEGVTNVNDMLQVVPASVADAVSASDAEVEKAVAQALQAEGTLADSTISVQSVNDGMVLLAGKAESLSAYLRALETAAAVPGVRAVGSEIESLDDLGDAEMFGDPGDEAGSASAQVAAGARDAWITSATKLRLLADGRTPGLDVNVDTHAGEVTLFGIVESEEAKRAAEENARKASGVKTVHNEITVVPSAVQRAVRENDAVVEDSVENAITSQQSLEKADISVSVRNGIARLTGTVSSQAERFTAATVARDAAGVRAVENDLRVARR